MIISCENIPESEFDIDFAIKIFCWSQKRRSSMRLTLHEILREVEEKALFQNLWYVLFTLFIIFYVISSLLIILNNKLTICCNLNLI